MCSGVEDLDGVSVIRVKLMGSKASSWPWQGYVLYTCRCITRTFVYRLNSKKKKEEKKENVDFISDHKQHKLLV